MRRWWMRAVIAAVVGGGALAATAGVLSARVAHSGPCGGELQWAATAPGGTGDAPGARDGRPEEFTPDEGAFAAVLAREGVAVQMSVFQTNFSHASASQAANIAVVAKKLTGRVIAPGAVFSYNGTAGPFTQAGGYGWGRMFVGERIVPTIGGGVCQGASTLYNVVLLANLPVVERHAHGLTVPYLDPGRDATVTESGGLDFRFRNNTGAPLVLWAQANDRWLTIALYGKQKPPQVEIETQVLTRTPFRTEVITDKSLEPGEQRVAAAGQEGAKAKTWILVHTPEGVRRTYLGEHTYRPSPRIILRGPTA